MVLELALKIGLVALASLKDPPIHPRLPVDEHPHTKPTANVEICIVVTDL